MSEENERERVTITTAPTLPFVVERPKPTAVPDSERPTPIVYEGTASKDLWAPRFSDRIVLLFTNAKLGARFVASAAPYFFTIAKGIIVKDWKTTVAGIVVAFASGALSIDLFGLSWLWTLILGAASALGFKAAADGKTTPTA